MKRIDLGEEASLLNAQRLAVKQNREYALAKKAAKIEPKLEKTSESLKILGAGRTLGQL